MIEREASTDTTSSAQRTAAILRSRSAMAMPMDSGLDPGNGAPPREGESNARMRYAPLVARFVLSSAVADHVVNRVTASFFLRDVATNVRYFERSIMICARQGWACRRVCFWAQAIRLHLCKGSCARSVRRFPLVSLFALLPNLFPAAGSLNILQVVSFRENARQSGWKGPVACSPTCAVGGMPHFLGGVHRAYYNALSFAAHAYSRRHAPTSFLVLTRTNATTALARSKSVVYRENVYSAHDQMHARRTPKLRNFKTKQQSQPVFAQLSMRIFIRDREGACHNNSYGPSLELVRGNQITSA